VTGVLVAHPLQQHSHQLAWALAEAGLLARYRSGIPLLATGETPPFWFPSRLTRRVKRAEIPPHLRDNPLIVAAAVQACRALPRAAQSDQMHRVFHWFDWWTAKQLARLKPDVVVAFENGAYHTFSEAKRLGIPCVLDAPSMHRSTQAALAPPLSSPYLAEINRRKDAEVERADLILTCSPLAAKSYTDAGVASEKVIPILLGAALPNEIPGREKRDGPVRFLFAGSLSYHKSTDLLLAAFRRLARAGIPYELQIVGGASDRKWITEIAHTPHTTYFGHQPQRRLYELLTQADCLVLPSRFDSFGMVVTEALACGTPVLLSRTTGAGAILDIHPQAGWVTDATEDALYGAIDCLARNRQALLHARHAAAEAGGDFSWSSYRGRVATLFKERFFA
jgi:glycosyltransferase involved in cell wall biosynthesis